ncbi:MULTISPECIES: UDP-glucose 4-epimerase GalE [unclassified Rathayibacter]|jgi:UDP-glucose 4-epimerase|uniref:UDP-glucose 4-epimerase GalE n=1 Tax=unclassified Rathayibacter TaxID=2609250 RepID=UPI000CE75259|nr:MULTISPECIES: UDP-glucose 4-epimerase GalE [unclassified Rathayibacter]PPF45062.1 UDP-glucose 4-epimerase GalE [Rathayibacter sp. AY1A1]PPG98958.1 UDP-glucose 4-epimerase GalE [Rathayibacter sp. AY1G9]
MRVLLVGGAGYIGSHTAVALLESGHEVLVVDDLSHASERTLDAVEELTGSVVPRLIADARDTAALTRFLAAHGPVDALVLLAGLKSVGDSVRRPLEYWTVNVGLATAAFSVAAESGIRTVVFSSSAAVYSPGGVMPVGEDSPAGLSAASPYGATKRVIEEILGDAARADPLLRAVSLRYFNPIGAHPSGRIGEDPATAPASLLPVLTRAAGDPSRCVDVLGDDYPTPDGTGLRDYIHVCDLAAGHVAALERARPGHRVYNLGTGSPTSVLELIDEVERASGETVRWRAVGRRPGDLAASWADPARAERELGWRAVRTVREGVRDQWRWQTLQRIGVS